jgi:hypothetical protein
MMVSPALSRAAGGGARRRKTLAVATVAVKPKMVKLILKEAFGISIGGPRAEPAR